MIRDIDVGSFLPVDAPPGALAQLDEGIAQELLSDIADLARAKWVTLAGDRLKRTASDYIRGIQPVELGEGIASITLLGVWPNKLEAGFFAYDLRDTLLGPGVPVGERGKKQNAAGGYYRSIFFRFMGPTSTGAHGQRVTDAYAKQLGAERATKLGKLAWKRMRELDPTSMNPFKRRLSTSFTPLDVKIRSHKLVTMPDGGKALIREGGPLHAMPLFEGAMKMSGRAHQAYYGTFRTISTSQPDGWIHPGYPGARLLEEVEKYIQAVAPDMVAQALAKQASGGA